MYATHSIKNPILSPLFGGGGSGNHFTVEHKTVLSCVVTCHFPPRAGFLFLPLFFFFLIFYFLFLFLFSYFFITFSHPLLLMVHLYPIFFAPG